jgi:hypothetical protein
MTIHLWLSMLASRLDALRETRDNDEGSVTLEQVVIAAGLLAAAVGLVAIIVAVVSKYSGKIN